MPGLLDRLFGREPDKKAVVGAGAYWMEHGTPLQAMTRNPTRLMAQAQQVYHTNQWVNAAESLIDTKFSTVGWHLERNGETLDEAQAPDAHKLLRQPAKDISRTALWQVTCRHLGLAGNAFWVLDQVDADGLPLGVLYLNPARVTPALDPRGGLRGWIVDADRPDGRDPIPLALDEVVHFILEPPDFGHFGIGKVEAVWRKIGLSNSIDSFAEGTMRSGGRKAHMLWPDAGYTFESEDVWQSWLNSLRNAAEDDTFTRRLTAQRFPVGALELGQTLSDLQIPSLSSLTRDDILAHWGVPPSQLGISAVAGLNSGERQKYEEAALWQNAIEPRLTSFAETLQDRLLDRLGITLIVEIPEFDDDLPLYEIASKATTVPHKVDELRALVGLDPLDETVYGKLGQALLLDKKIVELSNAPTDNVIPFPQRDDDDAEMPEPGEIAGKAKLVFTGLRQRIEKQYEPKLRGNLKPALTAQREAVKADINRHWSQIQAKPNDYQAYWNEKREHRRLEQALAPLTSLIEDSGRRLRSGFFASVKADNFMERVQDYVRLKVGERIRGINDTTRKAIRALIADGLREGLSPAELGRRIDELPAFNRGRAELISRTETMLAYNDAAIGTYRAFDVAEVQALDGDQDEVCAARNGNIYSLAEASGITDHPNGTLDWVPIVKAHVGGAEVGVTPEDREAIIAAIAAGFAKATLPSTGSPVTIHLPSELKIPAPEVTVNVPEQTPPVVNVTVPEQKTPTVTVNVPEAKPPVVNVPAAKATLPQEVRITAMPNRVHKAIRDKEGKIVGSSEEDD